MFRHIVGTWHMPSLTYALSLPVEHRPQTTRLHLSLSCAADSILQLNLKSAVHISLSRSLSQVLLGRPLSLWPCDMYCSTCLAMPSSLQPTIWQGKNLDSEIVCFIIKTRTQSLELEPQFGCAAPPTLAVWLTGVPPYGMERANGDITLYVTPEIVKNTDVQKMPRCYTSSYDTVSILRTCNECRHRAADLCCLVMSHHVHCWVVLIIIA